MPASPTTPRRLPKLPSNLCVDGFEFQVEQDDATWQPIMDATRAFVRVLRNKTGKESFTVKFPGCTAKYEASIHDGALMQRNLKHGTVRKVELRPGFGILDDHGKMRPIRDAAIADALFQVHLGNSPQRYTRRSGQHTMQYEARREVDADGTTRVLQTNTKTNRDRAVHLLPSYFAFEGDHGWEPIVDASSMHALMLLNKTPCSREASSLIRIESSLGEDGVLVQTDSGTGDKRRVRAGHLTGGASSTAPSFEFELSPDKWKRVRDAQASAAYAKALQGGGQQQFKCSDNKDGKEYTYEVKLSGGNLLTQKNVATNKERRVRRTKSPARNYTRSLLDAFNAVFLDSSDDVVSPDRRLPAAVRTRLSLLMRKQKPAAPLNADDAKLHIAHAAIHDAGTTIYGGFVRDWVIRGESANDIDVSTSNYDATERTLTETLERVSIHFVQAKLWGVTNACRRLEFSFEGADGATVPLEVDLVDPSKVPHTPPGVDCDVGNLKIDQRGGLQLKVAGLVSLEKTVKHAIAQKFVLFYEPSGDVARRRVDKYTGRGWTSKNGRPKYARRFWEEGPAVEIS